MSGRQVPWSSWSEWSEVRTWLHSAAYLDVWQGLHRVQAWRCRGRLPLGVDITAALVALQVQDPVVCRSGRFGWHAGPLLSEQSLQSEYALTIVRFVNGISDSSQKGRVAASVARQAEAAGLHALLVAVRHEATHNDLPSLHVLRLASDHAMAWLAANYWDAQSTCIAAASAGVKAALAKLWRIQVARLRALRAEERRIAQRASVNDDEDDEDRALEHASVGARELNRQRKAALGELKGIVLDGFAGVLADVLVTECDPEELMAQPAAATGRTGTKRPRGGDSGQPDGVADAAAVLLMLERHYPHVAACVLQQALSGALSAAARVGGDEDGAACAARCDAAAWWCRVALLHMTQQDLPLAKPCRAAQSGANASLGARLQAGGGVHAAGDRGEGAGPLGALCGDGGAVRADSGAEGGGCRSSSMLLGHLESCLDAMAWLRNSGRGAVPADTFASVSSSLDAIREALLLALQKDVVYWPKADWLCRMHPAMLHSQSAKACAPTASAGTARSAPPAAPRLVSPASDAAGASPSGRLCGGAQAWGPFRRAENWAACPLGTLPTGIPGFGRPCVLVAPPSALPTPAPPADDAAGLAAAVEAAPAVLCATACAEAVAAAPADEDVEGVVLHDLLADGSLEPSSDSPPTAGGGPGGDGDDDGGAMDQRGHSTTLEPTRMWSASCLQSLGPQLCEPRA